MRGNAPFQAGDLADLDELLLSRATAVLAMEDIHDGNRDPRAIGLRHDVDGTHYQTRHALTTAIQMAEWEAARGYRSTYYFLHTGPYWTTKQFPAAVERIAECGHEIGIHADALAQALRTGQDPDVILEQAIATLRGFGVTVRGVAGHGNPFCNRERGPDEITFANDEQFQECARPQEGAPDRTITRGNISLTLNPRPLADFGLEYEALKLGYARGTLPFRVSDSGGRWVDPGWDETVHRWNRERSDNPWQSEPTRDIRQLHALVHPDWWHQAFSERAVAA